MANKLSGFLDNFFGGVTNPKGNLGDYQHAARLYVDDTLRLAPKNKFLFFVNFVLTEEAQRSSGLAQTLRQKHLAELNMLVKTVDLPQYSANVEVKNQYNRKKLVQTAIDYTPVNIVLHDDNYGITTALLETYFKYYYRDSFVRDPNNPGDSYNSRNTYLKNRDYRYGLDNNRTVPFFKEIKIFQLSRQTYTEYTLVNPLVERWGHDSMDQSDNTGVTENTMIVDYETVRYRRGRVDEDLPATFATTHYDTTPSPITVPGGGVSNVFGAGGILDGGSSVLGDIASGEFGLGTILTGANTVKNLKDVNKGSLISEGIRIFNRAVVNTGRPEPGGIAGVNVPKDTASESETIATASTNSNEVDRETKIQGARVLSGRGTNTP